MTEKRPGRSKRTAPAEGTRTGIIRADVSWRGEIVGGLTTFATMAYILFVNPAIISAGTGMDSGALLVATALASAVGTLLMGFLAGYPIALAPGMGLNALFSFTICAQMGFPWQTALGMVFVSGSLFFLLTVLGLREKVLAAIPRSLQYGTAAGIGLFLALIGMEEAGWVVDDPATLVTLGDFSRPSAWMTAVGLLVTIVLMVRRGPGGILFGILITGATGFVAGVIPYQGIVGAPPSIAPTFAKLDLGSVFVTAALLPLFTLLFFDLLDTLGTLVGVGEQAGFLKDGRLPRARRALMADSLATVVGSVVGTSTVTSYIESAAGVDQGARTWRANVIVALLFLLALFFSPLLQMLGGGIEEGGKVFHPVTAPAIIVVGSLMARAMRKVEWNDPAEALPAFVTMIAMPVTYSIANGLAMGFIAASVADLARPGGPRHAIGIHILAVLFLLRYVFL